jgi:hypothetical protein
MSETTATPSPPEPRVPLATRDYRDPATLTQWVKVLLILSLLLDLIGAGSGVMELNLLRNFSNGTIEGDIDALANANDTRQQAIGIAQFVLFVVTGIVFLTWIFRANRNARALGAQGMRFTPGWSVGWYFVPIMSLWKPFQAMREIWQASVQPGNWQAVPTPPLIGWWWALYLINLFLGQIAFRMASAADGLDSAMRASAVTLASDISSIVLEVIAFFLVAKIATHQTWQAKTVEVF